MEDVHGRHTSLFVIFSHFEFQLLGGVVFFLYEKMFRFLILREGIVKKNMRGERMTDINDMGDES